eukprot:342372-Pyramimonas_sp.AAC.1
MHRANEPRLAMRMERTQPQPAVGAHKFRLTCRGPPHLVPNDRDAGARRPAPRFDAYTGMPRYSNQCGAHLAAPARR